MEDSEAIRLLKTGKLQGLETLVMRYQEQAIRLAFVITQDQAEAEDIVVDTFLRIQNRIHLFDESKAFKPYLMRSVVNACLNQQRRRNEALQDDSALPTALRLLDEARSVENLAEANELREKVHEALTKLSPHQRGILVERYFFEMSVAEMSDKHQSPKGTIKWWLSDARNKLRKLLSSERTPQ